MVIVFFDIETGRSTEPPASYRERLLADTSRPRLRPGVSLEEEIATVFHEREALHARVPTVPLVDFLRAFWREVTP